MTVRRRELILVVVVCGFLGWWSQRAKGPSAAAPALDNLQELSFQDLPFQYSILMKPDRSAEYRASLNCVSATPVPGKLGCQHLEGNLSVKQVNQLWSGLSATLHSDRTFLSATSPERRPGSSTTLELKFDAMSASISESSQSQAVFKALNRLHPGAIRKKLESKRASEERALKSSR
jgi:hypothetical protein